MTIVVNGEFVPEIPFINRGLSYGDGLFETMRYESGDIALWDYHLARLMRGSDVLGIKQDRAELEAELNLVLAQLRQTGIVEGVIKFRLIRGGNKRAYAPEANANNWRIFEYFKGLPLWGQVQTAIICKHSLPLHPSLAGIKHLNRLDQVMAAREIKPSVDTGIMLDTQGRLRCGIDSNIFLETENRILTPKVIEAGVAGVFRSYLLDQLCSQLNIEVLEQELEIDDLLAAKGLWLSNAVRGLRPVTRVTDINSWSEPYSPLLSAAAALARTKLGIGGEASQ